MRIYAPVSISLSSILYPSQTHTHTPVSVYLYIFFLTGLIAFIILNWLLVRSIFQRLKLFIWVCKLIWWSAKTLLFIRGSFSVKRKNQIHKTDFLSWYPSSMKSLGWNTCPSEHFDYLGCSVDLSRHLEHCYHRPLRLPSRIYHQDLSLYWKFHLPSWFALF